MSLKFFDADYIDDYPDNEEDLVIAVDIEGFVYIAHCRNKNWFCAITGRTILTPVTSWILIERADNRSTTPEQRKAIAHDVEQFCVY